MTDRPIIFSAPVVRALLAGRKTQTRRLISPAPTEAAVDRFQLVGTERMTGRQVWEAWHRDSPAYAFRRGRNQVDCYAFTPARDDLLWVREAWRTHHCFDDVAPRDLAPGTVIQYDADGPTFDEGLSGRSRPSIHMPRWASRIDLRVDACKIERLREISEADALAEGCFGRSPIADYRTLWESLHGPGAWRDTWVVVITFEVIRTTGEAS